MKIITIIIDIVTALLRLLEAEGRLLKKSVARLGWAIAFMMVASFLVLGAAGFFLFGMYQYLSSYVSPAAASFLVSLLTAVMAVVAGIIASSRAR